MPKEVLFDEDKVLQSATKLFWLKGYNGTSMDELTKVTGLSRSSIYNSFGDKHSLFIKCLDYYRKGQWENLQQAISKLKSPLKKIEMLFRHAVDELLNDKENKGCLIINTTAELANLETGISVFVKENMEAVEKMFRNWIKDGQESGQISKSFTSAALSRYLFNSFTGLKIISQTNNDRKTLEDIVKVSLSILPIEQ
jgi:TetR/AcrR family transcriptional repressor of nem operon